MTLSDKAATFPELHTHPELLVLVNVWDAVTARPWRHRAGRSRTRTAPCPRGFAL